METIETLPDAQYKDDSPIATVDKIRAILSSHNIEIYEKWHETSVPYCFALSIGIVGTTFSVNGKGLTREFARASAYGELMERLQMGYTGAPGMQKDGSYSFDETKYIPVPLSDLAQDQHKVYARLCQRLMEQTAVDMAPSSMLKQFANKDGAVPCASFYSLTNKCSIPFPNEIRMRVYGSNGCAAGNSIEEAIVQAISEIVERHNQSQIILNGIVPPDIPEEELKQHKTAYKIVSYVRAHGFRVIMKDCSLGQKFPVVCACFIQENTGKYHTHFGAAPIFEIALERALTESFQGRNIQTIAQFDDFLYEKEDIRSLGSVTHEFAKGTWKKSPDFFLTETNAKYNNHVGFSGSSNKILLKECVEYFRSLGLDILVYNSSTLGFPTCHVLIPGYSEVFSHRLCAKMDDHRYYHNAIAALRYPATASVGDMLGLLMHLDQMGQFTAETKRAHGFLNAARLSANLTQEQSDRLMSASLGYVYFTLGKFSQAAKCAEAMLRLSNGDEDAYLICLKRYLHLLVNGYDSAAIRNIMEFFHPQHIVNAVLDKAKNPFERFTLHCQLHCPVDCPIHAECCNIRITELDDLISSQLKKLSFSDFSQTLDSLLA